MRTVSEASGSDVPKLGHRWLWVLRGDDVDGVYATSPAAQRRHHDLVAPAGAAGYFVAGAELQVLAHADPHLAQASLVADHGDAGFAQARIGLDERGFDIGGGDRLRLGQFEKITGDFYRGARLAD